MSDGGFSVGQLLIDWVGGGMRVLSGDLIHMLIDLTVEHSVKMAVHNLQGHINIRFHEHDAVVAVYEVDEEVIKGEYQSPGWFRQVRCS